MTTDLIHVRKVDRSCDERMTGEAQKRGKGIAAVTLLFANSSACFLFFLANHSELGESLLREQNESFLPVRLFVHCDRRSLFPLSGCSACTFSSPVTSSLTL